MQKREVTYIREAQDISGSALLSKTGTSDAVPDPSSRSSCQHASFRNHLLRHHYPSGCYRHRSQTAVAVRSVTPPLLLDLTTSPRMRPRRTLLSTSDPRLGRLTPACTTHVCVAPERSKPASRGPSAPPRPPFQLRFYHQHGLLYARAAVG
jgi:hypothetical protein